jgi:hypothetical protein
VLLIENPLLICKETSESTAMTVKDTAHIRFTVNAVIHANGESHEMLGQRMSSAFGRAIGDGAITGDTAAETQSLDAKTLIVSPEAADLDEEQVAAWISSQIESGSMRLEDIARLMARYAFADPGEMREELAERMGLFESSDEPDRQVVR